MRHTLYGAHSRYRLILALTPRRPKPTCHGLLKAALSLQSVSNHKYFVANDKNIHQTGDGGVLFGGWIDKLSSKFGGGGAEGAQIMVRRNRGIN